MKIIMLIMTIMTIVTIMTIIMITKMMMMSCYCWLQSRNDAPAVGHDLWLRRRQVDVIIIIGHHGDDDDDLWLCIRSLYVTIIIKGDDDNQIARFILVFTIRRTLARDRVLVFKRPKFVYCWL